LLLRPGPLRPKLLGRPRAHNLSSFVPKQNLLVFVAGAITWILFAFPNIPIQVRYMVPLAGIGIFFLDSLVQFKPLKLTFMYLGYVIVVGLCVVLLNGKDDYADAIYPVRLAATSVVVCCFALHASPQLIILFSSSWMVVEFGGMLHDVLLGPIWQRLPFPIFSSDYQMLIDGRELQSDRLGGLTFEPGVVGGLCAMFILLNFSILYMSFLDRRVSPGKIWLVIAALGIPFGIATIFLAKTKSGLLVLACAIATFILASLLSRSHNFIKHRAVALALTVVLVGGLGVGYSMARAGTFGTYLQRELDNLYVYNVRGFQRDEGAGLKTRIEYMKAAIYGLPYHPLGVGMTDGESWIKPIEEKLDMTPEMAKFFGLGHFAGYKGYIFNMLMEGGVMAIALIGYMLTMMVRAFRMPHHPEFAVIGLCFAVAFVMLGLCVELLPYWELVLFVYCVALSLERNIRLKQIFPQGRSIPAASGAPTDLTPRNAMPWQRMTAERRSLGDA
jgi:hypothetical protein